MVATSPLFLNPDGIGFFNPCTTGAEYGCRDAQPGAVQPDSMTLGPFVPNLFPGAGKFGFGKGTASNNIEEGDSAVRMFLWWDDTGDGTPLSRIDQVAVVMVSAPANEDFFTDIVPEPHTALLVGLGLIGLATVGRQGR